MKNKFLFIMTLSASAAATISIINRLASIVATSKNLLFVQNAHCFKWRLGDIHYTKIGSGKPFLLIHDLTSASSGYEWSQIIHKLKDKYTVYTIDLLGCGRSEKSTYTYTNYLYAQLITDFIKSEIGHRTNVIATGESSALSIMACNNCPDLFDRIMLINPNSLSSFSQMTGKSSKLYKFILDLPIVGTFFYNIAYTKSNLTNEFSKEYFYNPYSVKPAFIDAYYESSHLGKSPKSIFASVKCHYTSCNINNCLKKIDHSIYLVGGAEIKNIKDKLEEYKKCNSAIEYSIFSNCKHLPQLEKPGELLQLIAIFFA